MEYQHPEPHEGKQQFLERHDGQRPPETVTRLLGGMKSRCFLGGMKCS